MNSGGDRGQEGDDGGKDGEFCFARRHNAGLLCVAESARGLLLFLLRSAVTCQVCFKFALDVKSKQGGRGSCSGAEPIENHAPVL